MKNYSKRGYRRVCGLCEKVLLFLLVVLLNNGELCAQKQGSIWYFGAYAGIDFNITPPHVLTDGRMNIWEGCASVSDAYGNLLFYTDGMSIWNREHFLMPNGTGLFGNPSSTQSGVIVPHPGNSNIFYVFSVDNNVGEDGLTYTVVDMTLNNGLGDVVDGTKNTLLFTPASEKITAVQHQNGKDIWVITHPFESDQFYTYLVTTDGFDKEKTVISTAGTKHTGYVDVSRGYMKASPDGDRLALALEGLNRYELFDFDNATGIVSNPVYFPGIYESAYGVEFSPDGKLLYGSERWSNELHQFDLSAPDIPASDQVIATLPTDHGGALQLAIDGKIYLARHGEGYLGVIEKPNEKGVACSYIEEGVSLGSSTSSEGLPNFITSFFRTTFNYDHVCLGEKVQFSVSDQTGIDRVEWWFDYPSSGIQSTELAPEFLYAVPGKYVVQLVTFRKGIPDTAKAEVLVKPLPVLDLGEDRTLCEGASIQSGHMDGTFAWSTGESSPSMNVSSTGTYSLLYTDAYGCAASDEVNIAVMPAPKITYTKQDVTDAGKQNGWIDLSVTDGTAPYTYSWSPTGATTQDVNSLNAELHTVTVTGQNACATTERIKINSPVNCDRFISLESALPLFEKSVNVLASGMDSEGNLYVGGYSTDPFTFDGQEISSESFLMLISPEGKLLKHFGTELLYFTHIEIDKANIIHAVGFFWEDIDFGNGNKLVAPESVGGFTMEFNQQLEVQNTYSGFGSETNYVSMYNVDDDQNEYILAYFSEDITFDGTVYTAGAYRINLLLFKRDKDKNVLWHKKIEYQGTLNPEYKNFVHGDKVQLNILFDNFLIADGTTIAQNGPQNTLSTINFDAETGAVLSYNNIFSGVENSGGHPDQHGGYYVWGNFQTEIALPDITLRTQTPNNPAAFILHYDANHTLIDSQVIENTGNQATAVNMWLSEEGDLFFDMKPRGWLKVGDEDIAVDYAATTVSLKFSEELEYLDYVERGIASASTNNPPMFHDGNLYRISSGTEYIPMASDKNMSYLYKVSKGGDFGIEKTVSPAYCGAPSVQISVEGKKGEAPYNYLWESGETTNTLTDKTEGTYPVKVYDSRYCVAYDTVRVSIPDQLSATVKAYNVSEKGKNDGSIDIEVLGGTAPFTYVWSSGQTTQDIKNLAAGTYEVEITDVAGCQTTISATITEPDTPIKLTISGKLNCATASNGSIDLTIEGGNPPFNIEWSNGATTEDISGLSAGTYSVTVSDNLFTETAEIELSSDKIVQLSVNTTNVCRNQTLGSAEVIASGGNEPYSYNWSSGGKSATATALSTGSYTVTVTDANSCATSESVEIKAFDLPVLHIEDQILACEKPLVMAVEAGYAKYEWAGVSADNYVVELSTTGTVSLTVTDLNGCQAADDFDVTATSPIPIDLGEDRRECTNEPVELIAPVGFSDLQWSTGENSQSILVSSTATYSVSATDINGCVVSDEIRVAIFPKPSLDLGEDITACDVNRVDVSAPVGFVVYQWSSGQNTQAISVSSTGTYTLVVTDANNCEATDAVDVILGQTPAFDLGEDIVQCGTTPVLLAAPTGYAMYDWSTGESSESISVDVSDEYSLTVQDAAGCEASDEITVQFYDAPEIDLPETVEFCRGESTLLDAGDGTVTYLWQDGSTDRYFLAEDEGLYAVKVENEHCSTIATVTVVYKACECEAIAPNIFTPNGDDANEYFHLIWQNTEGIVNPNVLDYEMRIYSRWGRLIYQTTEQDKPWDGTNNGLECPSGDYYFTIRFQCPDNSETFKGNLRLQK